MPPPTYHIPWFQYDMPKNYFLCIYPTYDTGYFLNLQLNVFHQFWKSLGHCFSNILSVPFFLSSPSGIVVTNILDLFTIFHIYLLVFFIFFHNIGYLWSISTVFFFLFQSYFLVFLIIFKLNARWYGQRFVRFLIVLSSSREDLL